MGILVLFGLPFLFLGWLFEHTLAGGEKAVDWIKSRRDRKRAAVERELDRQQAELRSSILKLASSLGADAHEARKALIRESYLASGKFYKEQ